MKVFVSTTRLKEDESVSFSPCDDFEMFGGGVSPEEVGVDDVDVASLL